MVSPLRVSQLSLNHASLPSGLYIIGDSNARHLPIPHLPTIGAENPTPGAININLSSVQDDVNTTDLLETFSNGDIIWIDAAHNICRCILSKEANANTLLVTEQCDNRCSFCSQPPNYLPDAELYQKATLALLNYNTSAFVGISGGEPTLNRSAFLAMLRVLNQHNVKTPLHILTNGRSLADANFVNDINSLTLQNDIVWGIPLYSADSKKHDALVGSHGAFVETVKGLINLGSSGQFIELRIIPVQENLSNLVNLIEFIASSLPFVSVISIMNLEPKGWARKNFSSLFVSVKEQAYWLETCIACAQQHRLPIRLFNYPLCLLPEEIRSFSCQSISDWKNYYPPLCELCELKNECGGFFTSATGQFFEAVEPIIWKS